MPAPSRVARPLYTTSSDNEAAHYNLPGSPAPSRNLPVYDSDDEHFSNSRLPHYVPRCHGHTALHYPAEPTGQSHYSRRSSIRSRASVSPGDHDSPEAELQNTRHSRISISSSHDSPEAEPRQPRHSHISISSDHHRSPEAEPHHPRRSRSRSHSHIYISSDHHDSPEAEVHQLQEQVAHLKTEHANLLGKIEGIT